MKKGTMRLPFVVALLVVAMQITIAQTGIPVDVFPLAIGNQWVYRYQRVDSLPYANPATITVDTGTVTYTITDASITDPVHWVFEEHRDLRRHIYYFSSTLPDSFTVIRDSSVFEMLEELHGQHWTYRSSQPYYYESLSVFSFDRDFTDTTKVYRYRPVGQNGTVTFLSQVPPGDIPFVLTFEQGVGLTHVSGWWSILSGRVYCEHQLRSWNFLSTAVSSERTLPSQTVLEQNYPNPFNPTTTINFSVETPGLATLEVYNLLGQLVATPFKGYASPGQSYGASFSGASMPSSMYLYRLTSGARTETKRMVLMK